MANKVDLYKDEQITNDIGKAYADEINAIFQNTSALSNSGIDKLFENLGNKFLNPDFDYKKPQETNENVNSNENIRTGGKNGKNKDKNGKEKIKLKDEPKGTMEKKRNCC